ncbi:hypothetical protein QMK19_38980 [Streptomyces sp. H10-C2]|uniref:hypothetical protein n=1 Tax=unclassified Streptomyces TaxID=2593676 RepID=UPI0022AF04C2|nr:MULTISPECIES: hypothetical protein [unclassified Streptomyces]MCZ4103534.1 hypothetical protein [Streptomyces sp. H39-C1]MDJ0347161.1 hypothetical protein [Streptomyces sp. PH10-H1]MDJ0375420.1 hypothetical protein [Streptomyces sp. H10-C2]
MPLDQAPIDHVTATEQAALPQLSGDTDTDAGELEQGVADRCSPWACRGSATEPEQDDFELAT